MGDIVANKSVTIYGPGTIAGDGGTIDGSSLVAKDLEWNGSPGCVNTAANLPPNRVELRRVRVALTTNMLVGEVCEVMVSDSKLTYNGTVPAPLISIVGELAGVNGATVDRQSKIDITRTILTGGDPALSVGLLGTVNVTNSVFQNQGTTYGWVFVFPSSTSTNKVEFSTLHNSVLKCGVSGTGYLAMSNNIMVNARAGAPADTVTGTYCSHSYDLIRPQSTAVPGPGNKLGVDPMFVNPFAGNFQLQPGSPAIDAADPAATQALDYDGVPRPQGTGRDMGAFEYH